MLIGGVGSVHGVSEQGYQPCLRDNLRNSLWNQGMVYIARGGLSGYGHPPVFQPGLRKPLAIPLRTLFVEMAEEAQLFLGGGFDVRMLAQEAVEERRPAPAGPDEDKVR